MTRSSAIASRVRARPELAGLLASGSFGLSVAVAFWLIRRLEADVPVSIGLTLAGGIGGYYLGRTLVRAFYRPLG